MSEVTIHAPGRVNLIGEHTDYMHLPVLPIAIQRGISVSASLADEPGIVARSTAQHGPAVVSLSSPEPEGWGRYLLGVLRQLADEAIGKGAELHVDGDLPATGGLSSSSALTTGVLKALVTLWGIDMDDDEVVRRAIAAERIVGVESGGMDQTVIMFGTEGAALRIDWDPLQRHVVPLPPEFRFVIGYSGDEAAKGGAARVEYNERVVSCRAAALLLEDASGISAGSPPMLRPFAALDPSTLALPESATSAQVARDLDIDVEIVVGLASGRFAPTRALRIARAASHVLTEAVRVEDAEQAIADADIDALGALFDASHASLQVYGVSTPGLDAVTAAARDAGASGARLTGAGFGGWAVAVCREDQTDAVVSAMAAARGGLAFEVVASGGIR